MIVGAVSLFAVPAGATINVPLRPPPGSPVPRRTLIDVGGVATRAQFINNKAKEAVNALLDGAVMDPTRNVEVRLMFAEPFQKYSEVWEIRPKHFAEYCGLIMLDRAITCEVNRIKNAELPNAQADEYADWGHLQWEANRLRHLALRRQIQEALRSVEVLVWCVPGPRGL